MGSVTSFVGLIAGSETEGPASFLELIGRGSEAKDDAISFVDYLKTRNQASSSINTSNEGDVASFVNSITRDQQFSLFPDASKTLDNKNKSSFEDVKGEQTEEERETAKIQSELLLSKYKDQKEITTGTPPGTSVQGSFAPEGIMPGGVVPAGPEASVSPGKLPGKASGGKFEKIIMAPREKEKGRGR